jgi:RimJ/RimL family protein N-acetyltransferase
LRREVGVGSTVKGERVTLRDGAVVVVRQVRPGDAALLADGFARLSEESRRLRFLSAKERLTAAELRYFTEVDHHDHEALGALDETDGRGLGVARYIRHPDDPQAAEVAVTVVDEWQRRGLGTELLTRLIDRAREEGVRRFTALVSADNDATIGLLQGVGADVRAVSREPGVVEYEITSPPEGLGSTYDLLRAFGQRQLSPPRSIRDTLAALVPERFRTGE